MWLPEAPSLFVTACLSFTVSSCFSRSLPLAKRLCLPVNSWHPHPRTLAPPPVHSLPCSSTSHPPWLPASLAPRFSLRLSPTLCPRFARAFEPFRLCTRALSHLHIFAPLRNFAPSQLRTLIRSRSPPSHPRILRTSSSSQLRTFAPLRLTLPCPFLSPAHPRSSSPPNAPHRTCSTATLTPHHLNQLRNPDPSTTLASQILSKECRIASKTNHEP